ncbi:hypothetical protein S83_048360 [Arachis hypogaea]
MKRDLVNCAVELNDALMAFPYNLIRCDSEVSYKEIQFLYGWSVNVPANTGTGRSQYVNAGELSGRLAALLHILNKLINIGVLALTLI